MIAKSATKSVRAARRPVHGVLLLDKPIGLSSNQALQKVKWLLHAKKAGHTGTLDPMATGVLPLCFGAATKFAQIHLDEDKRYEAIVRLGVVTTTGDCEGDVVKQSMVNVDEIHLQNALTLFNGDIVQLPPMYSALKFEGKALYEYARAGIDVERKTRQVTVRELDAHLVDENTFTMNVLCSKGTYIRTLASDIGAALGCGASLIGLKRLASGNVKLEHCITLEQIEAMSEAQRMKLLRPPHMLLEKYPIVTLNTEDAGRFLTGARRRIDEQNTPFVQVMDKETHTFLGLGSIFNGELIAKRLLSPIEITEYIEQTLEE